MAEAALDGDLAAEGFDEAAHQGQAEAGAGFIGRGIEAVEDGGEALGLDAAAGVAHGELHEVLDLFGGEQDLRRRAGV